MTRHIVVITSWGHECGLTMRHTWNPSIVCQLHCNCNILSSDLVEQGALSACFLSTTDSHQILRAYASYSTELYVCWLITPYFSLPPEWEYSSFRDVKKSNLCSGDGGQAWLHNHMNVFHTAELSVYLNWGGRWILCYGYFNTISN